MEMHISEGFSLSVPFRSSFGGQVESHSFLAWLHLDKELRGKVLNTFLPVDGPGIGIILSVYM